MQKGKKKRQEIDPSSTAQLVAHQLGTPEARGTNPGKERIYSENKYELMRMQIEQK